MASIRSSPLPNGLPIHRVELEGTRAVTVLVAFDAGARTERPEENGMAHFLEHLVFKGGEKYDDYRKVNETAERMGAMLNAYTSHDLVAFHITCRAEVGREAIDLLTDFVGRPKIDAEELDRERGVVIQEIARSNDQPSVVAEHLIDRAAFGDHPLGPPRARPGGAPAHVHARGDRRVPRAASGRARAAARSSSATSSSCPTTASWPSAFGRFPSISPNGGCEPAPPFAPQTLVEERDSNQSHLRMSYRPQVDPRDREQRAALTVYSTLLGGSMGSRLFDEIREQRGLAYSVYSIDHSFADVPILQLSAGLESGKCVEAYRACARSSTSCATNGPAPGGVRARPRLRRRPPRAGVREHERRRAPRGRPDRRVRRGHRPRRGDRGARRDDARAVAEVARGISVEASVACVGPHEVAEFA